MRGPPHRRPCRPQERSQPPRPPSSSPRPRLPAPPDGPHPLTEELGDDLGAAPQGDALLLAAELRGHRGARPPPASNRAPPLPAVSACYRAGALRGRTSARLPEYASRWAAVLRVRVVWPLAGGGCGGRVCARRCCSVCVLLQRRFCAWKGRVAGANRPKYFSGRFLVVLSTKGTLLSF